MRAKTVVATLLLGTGFVSNPVYAQDAASATTEAASEKPMTAADLESLRASFRASRKEATASSLQLTDAEAARFWPVYDQYAAELVTIKNGQVDLIAEYVNNYGKYGDKAAMDFINRWLDFDAKTSALRTKYVPIVGKVLPGVKAATFFQIDRRLNNLADLEAASKMPLLQYQAAK